MRVFHVTTADDWAAARRAGCYTVSTRGRTLAQVGFVHCSTADQVAGTRALFFADVPDVVVLEVETDLLTSPWRLEPADPAAAPAAPAAPEASGPRFPHVYGPLDLAAVVGVVGPDDAEDGAADPSPR